MGAGLGARARYNPGQCGDRHCAVSRSACKLVCCNTSRGTARHRRRLVGNSRDSYIEGTVSRRTRRIELPLEPTACRLQKDRSRTTRTVFVRSTIGKNTQALTLLAGGLSAIPVRKTTSTSSSLSTAARAGRSRPRSRIRRLLAKSISRLCFQASWWESARSKTRSGWSASSLDGFVADPNDHVVASSWITPVRPISSRP